MRKNLKVSVVIPVYNQEAYLDVSIPSVLIQTFNNLEVVIVDDGSVDNSFNILQKYAERDFRIKIIRKKNGGLVSATIAGVRECSGDYICFLDPDDFYGKNFVYNLIKEVDQDTDVVAAGFYQDYNGNYEPVVLKNNIYFGETLEQLKHSFLIEKGVKGVSNQIFISRWNKCYKASTIFKMIDEFEDNTNITLGEDTIFTYLVLRYSKKIKVLSFPNEYFYNIGNQSSMMKNGSIQMHMTKSRNAYIAINKYLEEDGFNNDTALALYYFLIESLFNRILRSHNENYKEFSEILKKDELYYCSTEIIKKTLINRKDIVVLFLKRKYPMLYYYCFNYFKKSKPIIKWFLKEPKTIFNDLFNVGIKKSYYLYQFRKKRKYAFIELNDMLPELENRIYPYIKDRLNEVTLLSECPIEKNVFVFWWDGFDVAPEIVKKCLKSVKKFHKSYNIIEITKDTYNQFTNIDPHIISGFEQGKISVQTFSDILRFNLLKNNGGVWIDATIFFASEFDLVSKLESKSFESVEFSSSSSFLEYDGLKCSWSGYYIASRKNGVLVTIIDDIFKKYYADYHTFSIYFFIDAVFMICKKYKIDDAVLDKVQYKNKSMFLLSRILNCSFDDRLLEQIKEIPQKLSWFGIISSGGKNNMSDYLFSEDFNEL